MFLFVLLPKPNRLRLLFPFLRARICRRSNAVTTVELLPRTERIGLRRRTRAEVPMPRGIALTTTRNAVSFLLYDIRCVRYTVIPSSERPFKHSFIAGTHDVRTCT